MIREVIIVEGKQDMIRVKQAVEAEIITTGGFTLAPFTLSQIEQAYKKRGIIILTDPDSAGERIRKFLSHRFPDACHAFVPRDQAKGTGGIGIEEASPQAICDALEKVRCHEFIPSEEFSLQDMLDNGLSGNPTASFKRDAVGAILGIGYSNAKQFLYRLNHYGVSREEFNQAISALEETE